MDAMAGEQQPPRSAREAVDRLVRAGFLADLMSQVDQGGVWLGFFPGDPSLNGERPVPIHSVAVAALAQLYERSLLPIRLVNGRWATLRCVRTEPGAAETVSVIIGPPDAEQLSRVMAAIYGFDSA
jgi:hypothetical protein